ncbi:LacI family DNA-binding transcriptional regulator [Parasphaerochaeta coccoides]|uniref:Transcriptional regulator, LacI family n=1 Tax=Parasphaerochaeta coccoides (strain ATCC BAA-1237 / DSM 17374 / SPN1) TaxID=760011 RepID=F4GIG4_PARC1|nr:LacI family DNA-binding transcriptional regulator [Parasphaerochaeta coccoides]AEC01672.1 transcriptional regulator, LacI family [Parasphaerochaeta coccoides DSM 17374]
MSIYHDKRPTIKDIAAASGYSKTAVSFAFNAPSRISVEAREKILGCALTLGYVPDPMARNLSLKRYKSIGFLLPQVIGNTLRNPHITGVLQGIGTVCQEHGYTLTLIPPVDGSMSEAVRGAAVDGLITMGMSVEMKIVDMMKLRKLPYVTIDGTPSEGMPSVNINEVEAAYLIMREVLKAGHQSIVIIALNKDSFEAADKSMNVPTLRLKGYHKALREAGIDPQGEEVAHLVCDTTLEEGRRMGQIVYAMERRPTAVVSMSDIVAIGAILHFHESGLLVPDDMSVVGFDDIPEASFITPRLTTIRQSSVEKGTLAAQALFRAINGEEIESNRMELSFTIQERESLKKLVS